MNEEVFPDEYDAGSDSELYFKSFQFASGGQKLYDNEPDSWYWDLFLVMPEKYFTTDRIIYQWITYTDGNDGEMTGAVACKVQVGNTDLTSVDQWNKATDLSSDSEDIIGQPWYKQQRNGKMSDPLYRAKYWDTIFELVDSDDRSGYKVQHCVAELTIEDGALPDGITVKMNMGARFYADDTATEFLSTTYDDKDMSWHNNVLEYDPIYEIEPVYDVETAKGKVEAEVKAEPATLDTSLISQDRIDNYNDAVTAAQEAAEAAENANANGDLAVIFDQNSRQADDITATMSVGHGWTIYENEVESDYWWWYIATEMGDALVSDGDILYQWATMIDQSSEYTEDPFTVGCKIAKGTDDTYVVQVFTHTADTTTWMQADADSVVGKAWEGQDPTELEDVLADTKWSAGNTHHGSNAAPAASADLDTNFACYFAKEYAKIGRDPNDFNKDFEVTIGARMYTSDAATTFDTIPSPDAFTVTLSEPDSYNTNSDAGATGLFAATLAACAMLLAFVF